MPGRDEATARLTDALARQAGVLNRPLVPKSAIAPLQDWLDVRRVAQAPWEAGLRGLAAGSLEGLRELTSPLGVAALTSPWLRAGRAAAPLVRRGAKVAEVSPEVLAALDARITGLLPKATARTPLPVSVSELAKEDAFRRFVSR